MVGLVPWEQLADDPATVERYQAKVHRRGPDQCHYWLGAVSDTGHGKLRAGSRTAGTSRVVTAHVLGWAIEYGTEALRGGAVVRHRCDEPSCQNPEHWTAGERVDNIADYYARRRHIGHALGDARGAAGRAVAIREAILAALPGDVEAAIAAAIEAGNPSGAAEPTLF